MDAPRQTSTSTCADTAIGAIVETSPPRTERFTDSNPHGALNGTNLENYTENAEPPPRHA